MDGDKWLNCEQLSHDSCENGLNCNRRDWDDDVGGATERKCATLRDWLGPILVLPHLQLFNHGLTLEVVPHYLLSKVVLERSFTLLREHYFTWIWHYNLSAALQRAKPDEISRILLKVDW